MDKELILIILGCLVMGLSLWLSDKRKEKKRYEEWKRSQGWE